MSRTEYAQTPATASAAAKRRTIARNRSESSTMRATIRLLACAREQDRARGHDALPRREPREDGDPSIVPFSGLDLTFEEARSPVLGLPILDVDASPLADLDDRGARNGERLPAIELDRQGDEHLGLQDSLAVG